MLKHLLTVSACIIIVGFTLMLLGSVVNRIPNIIEMEKRITVLEKRHYVCVAGQAYLQEE